MEQRTAMIVEDELIPALYLQTLLESHGVKVVGVAKRGAEAIEMALREKPQVIVLDIYLKDQVSGVDVAEEVRFHYDARFLFTTAVNDSRVLKRAFDASPGMVFRKPYCDEDLLKGMATLWTTPAA